MATQNEQYRTIDKFDRLMGALAELPDVTRTKATKIVTTSPLIGATQTFIVQTTRWTTCLSDLPQACTADGNQRILDVLVVERISRHGARDQ